VAGNLLACFTKTELQGGVGGGVAFGTVGQDGGDSVMPGDGDGGGADPVELGDEADVESVKSKAIKKMSTSNLPLLEYVSLNFSIIWCFLPVLGAIILPLPVTLRGGVEFEGESALTPWSLFRKCLEKLSLQESVIS